MCVRFFLEIYLCNVLLCDAYKNQLFTIVKTEHGNNHEFKCDSYEGDKNVTSEYWKNYDSKTIAQQQSRNIVKDPFYTFQKYLQKIIFGENREADDQLNLNGKDQNDDKSKTDSLRFYVMGNFMQSELFNNKSGVHLPPLEFIQHGYCDLKITRDFMQTAVNAFAIFLYGSLSDIKRLPADYVLRSTRSISMMKIAREKLVATWSVIRGSIPTKMITIQTLELYRPLFKYVNGREIARLNLSDERILNYVGTHDGLDRHQVGVIASRYIDINKNWMKPKYLNLMNNLLCGVPMTFMRKLPVSTYLQLSHQVFYHIRACDPLQRRFYLAMMTRTQVLGKSYSWNARDVSRLGLLLAEVDGIDLTYINPKAMSGINSQVMLVMPAESLQYLSETQLQYIGPEPMNILGRKLKAYQDQLQLNMGLRTLSQLFEHTIVLFIIIIL